MATAAAFEPAAGGDAASERLAPTQELVFPSSKRVITQYLDNAAGQKELFLFYGDQEISFDEPELFAFGETLGKQARFAAGDATQWGSGYAWERVQELLEQLLQAGILEHAPTEETETLRPDGARPSPLPPGPNTQARTWWECAAISQELTGRSIALAHLELVVPVFRVAHMVLDSEGRQVGEANVFPRPMRMDVPTNWRQCIYPGSRFEDERPMNVTALKSMRSHWPAILAAIASIREAYLQRFAAARAGWTLGDVECLTTLVLAVPTYALMKPRQTVANGALHPVLSNMFRVTDGVRLTTHQMMFVPVAEATLLPQVPISSAQIYAYAERNFSFASEHGVCAGPRHMIEELLGVLIDGRLPASAQGLQQDPAVQAALDEMQPAFDYGLLGLQAHAALFSMWPMMTRTYEQLHTLAQQWEGPEGEALERLRTDLAAKSRILATETLHATEAWRANREQVYAAIYAHCAHGLGESLAPGLSQRIAELSTAPTDALKAQLDSVLRPHFGVAEWVYCGGIDSLAQCLADYFLHSQAVLEISEGLQERINALLQRAPAPSAFTASDVDVHMRLQGAAARRLPHLFDALPDLLGLSVEVTRHGVTVHPPVGREPQAASGFTPFADTVLANSGV